VARTALALPILTLPDPKISGEGKLDPLGLSTLADHLADRVLPGLTARMSRPRFLTAIAVCTAVCDGLEGEQEAAGGGVEPFLAFEWYLVEAFARSPDSARMVGTPGTDKAARALRAGVPMSVRAYLKTPTVFGYHGLYKRLARHLGIVDPSLHLAEVGVEVLRVWERERGLSGFSSATNAAPSEGARYVLRAAVADALRHGCTRRSPSWQGWSLLSKHLAPGDAGPREREVLLDLLREGGAEGVSREIFRLMSDGATLARIRGEEGEVGIWRALSPLASAELRNRFAVITAYEELCRAIEEAFDCLRVLSSRAGARPVERREFTVHPRIEELSGRVPVLLEAADGALDSAPLPLQREFGDLAEILATVRSADALFDALRHRHEAVQRSKPPDGKRPWFEYAGDDSAFVRPAYRLDGAPREYAGWGRPYRLAAARSFCVDLQGATA
jgi:hypothetical protein